MNVTESLVTPSGEETLITSLALFSKHAITKAPNTEVSPVTLSPEWSRVARLLLLSCLSVVGSVGNIFLISSIMIEDHLKKAGNAFIVSVALADLLITSLLIPSSAILLLAGIDDSLSVCKFQWFLAACAFLISVLSLSSTAVENYLRLCTSQDGSAWFNKTSTTVILLLIWLIGGTSSGLQFVFSLSFDYCTRKSTGIVPYQMAIVALLILLPIVVTFYTHVRIILDVRRLMQAPNYKPSLGYTWDLSLARTNFYSFLVFIVFWLPFGVVFTYGTTKIIPDSRVLYNTAWFGLSKSCIHNAIYCLTNRHFRSAYVSLFHYCCCKTTVSTARRTRTDGARPTADVRVHIIPGYNMYSYTSPMRNSGNNYHWYWGKRTAHQEL
ncbi:melatonin receptor type 1B-A-like [Phlebotomus argentipes]|uniref:melatonin receptor type 1B-A-like n=1 Tax=Phlebotomus argentipes TaxID=94469 RepID=UPI0028937622|nr:melatonin receptor type 1B-A-like [Phlebotomus argentipes]